MAWVWVTEEVWHKLASFVGEEVCRLVEGVCKRASVGVGVCKRALADKKVLVVLA